LDEKNDDVESRTRLRTAWASYDVLSEVKVTLYDGKAVPQEATPDGPTTVTLTEVLPTPET
jgi:hypothetical protein